MIGDIISRKLSQATKSRPQKRAKWVGGRGYITMLDQVKEGGGAKERRKATWG